MTEEGQLRINLYSGLNLQQVYLIWKINAASTRNTIQRMKKPNEGLIERLVYTTKCKKINENLLPVLSAEETSRQDRLRYANRA
jgi:hypothetical protein